MFVLILLPLGLSRYSVYVVNLWGIALVGATGLYILLGMTGLISLGHGIFLMVGAVTAALLQRELNAPIWITIPSAGVVTALVGSIVGLPSNGISCTSCA